MFGSPSANVSKLFHYLYLNCVLKGVIVGDAVAKNPEFTYYSCDF